MPPRCRGAPSQSGRDLQPLGRSTNAPINMDAKTGKKDGMAYPRVTVSVWLLRLSHSIGFDAQCKRQRPIQFGHPARSQISHIVGEEALGQADKLVAMDAALLLQAF